ncbi:thiamine pyrophosphate-dependent enzyme [Buchananella hordeovulneris]|uniref:thiamine pyrophosphate-dependent enzyme n=1 Tax=Buchananella hordeovulneris TaxID=52770 RepID=UPI001C9E1D8B|nr:thiamine pyrophosphate-dependent enzyme [Buchananella hordeovulneris]
MITPPATIRLLDANGTLTEHETYSPYLADLTDTDLVDLYRSMVLARHFDTAATNLQRHGELALWVPLRGQEGIQAGTARALQASDILVPSYREQLLLRARGITSAQILSLFRGACHGGWDPVVTNTHVPTLVIGAQAHHAVGRAQALNFDAQAAGRSHPDRAVVVCFGDGATSQGDVNEAMVFAASTQAPVVFLCQNNGWAISVPTTVQARVPIAARAPGFGIPSVRVDGNDPLASYAVLTQSLRRARSGGGPSFVEAVTYRMGAHTTSDDPTRYRTAAEEEAWAAKDPIARLATFLRRRDLLDDARAAEIEEEGREVAAEARAAIAAIDPGSPVSFFAHVTALPHPLIAAEREWFTQFQASFSSEESSQ